MLCEGPTFIQLKDYCFSLSISDNGSFQPPKNMTKNHIHT